MEVLAFHTSRSRRYETSYRIKKNNISKIHTKCLFSNCTKMNLLLCNDFNTCHLNTTFPRQEKLQKKQDCKRQSSCFNHRVSFDTKGPNFASSEVNSHIRVILDDFTHYVALKHVPHCNAYYAYTTLYEHWMPKHGLPEILVTDN